MILQHFLREIFIVTVLYNSAELLNGVDETHANPIRAKLRQIAELTSMEYCERLKEVSKVLEKANASDAVWSTIIKKLRYWPDPMFL